MKRITLIFFLCIPFICLAQKKKRDISYYQHTEDGKAANDKNAAYLGILEKFDDTTWQWNYYHYTGPIIAIETYRDQELKILNGYIAYFDHRGKIDSSGYTWNGIKDKNWFYFNDSLRIIQAEEYDKGVLLERKTEEDLNQERLKALQDPALDGTEANFKGGEKNWRKYLEKNFKLPQRALNLSKSGTAMSSFTVSTDGSLENILLVQSVEYSFDDAFLELLKNSPRWEPAVQNGKPVRAYRRQPMTISSQ